MPAGIGGIFPTEYRSDPVHPDRDVIRRGQPNSATTQGSLGGSTSRDQAARSRRSPKEGRRKHRETQLQLEWLAGSNPPTEKTAMEKIVRKMRTKGGHNPAGRRYRLVPTTPGSAGTNLGNPLVKQAKWDMIKAIFPFIANAR